MGIFSIYVNRYEIVRYYGFNGALLDISLPEDKKRIGVMVSGGIDSALLYFLLLKEKQLHKSDHIIFPIVMFRQEGSKYYSRPIIDKINNYFDISIRAKRFGDETLPNHLQLESAILQAISILQLDKIYVGVIQSRPEHFIGFTPIPIPVNEIISTPFIHLEKDSIVKIYYDLGIEEFLQYTFSCDRHEQKHCNNCNGCSERAWGFAKLGKVDPIKI